MARRNTTMNTQAARYLEYAGKLRTNIAKEVSTPENKAHVYAAAASFEALAMRLEKSPPGEIETLPDTASKLEINHLRRQCAVRHNDNVYLPIWQESHVGLPYLLLRSSLFAAATPGEMRTQHLLNIHGRGGLEITGPQLCDYDRRMFAVCLDQYRDKPLATNPSQRLSMTFWKLAKAMGVCYSKNVHLAIRNSLQRLGAARLRIQLDSNIFPEMRLVEVALENGCTDLNFQNGEPKGSDQVEFCVLESVAILFHRNGWTAISGKALREYKGLASWLIAFYATHAKPYPLTLAHLYACSGSTDSMSEFRKRLKNALTKLQNSETPDSCRIDKYELDESKATVHLVRWTQK